MSIDRTQKSLTPKPGYSAYTTLVGLWMFALAGFAQGPHGEWHRRQGEAENSYRQGDYSHSVRLASEALGIARRNAAFEEIAQATQLLAKNLIVQGHYLKAKIHLQEAIAAWANTDTPNAILLSTAHNSLAGIEHRLGNDETARTEYSRAIDILEAARGETHPKLSSILNGLGNLQLRNGELAAAKASFSRALSIREESLHPRDPALAACLINLGKVFQAEGANAVAQQHLDRALKIQRRALGPNHPDLARTAQILAQLHLRQHQDEEARILALTALRIQENALGVNHANLIETLSLLGAIHKRSGEFPEAEPLYRRAIGIAEHTHGSGSPVTGVTYHNLGVLLADQGLLSRAEPLFRKAIKASERAGNISNLQRYKSHLAALLRATGRSEEADRLIPEKPPTEQESSDQPVLD